MTWILVRLYRATLRVLAPADLRREFGAQIESVFEDVLEEARARGRLDALVAWMSETVQLLAAVRALRRTAHRGSSPLRSNRDRLNDLAGNLRVASTALRRRPLFALSSVATLGVGLGLSAAVWAAARASVLHELPVPDPDRVVIVHGAVSGPRWSGNTGATVRELEALAEERTTIESLALFSLAGDATVTEEGTAQRLDVKFVSPAYFDVLGAEAARGRLFGPGDRDVHEVVLAHRTWVRTFASDPAIVGRAIVLAGEAYTVVGVLPEDHWGLDRRRPGTDAWIPLGRSGPTLGADVLESLTRAPFWAVARLRPGRTRDDALEALSGLHESFRDRHPLPTERSIGVMGLRAYFFGGARGPILAVALGALLILVVCAVNLGSLTWLRARERRHEMAVRSAIGGGRWRLVQAALAESFVVALAGSILALMMAQLAVTAFSTAFGATFFRFETIRLGWQVTGAVPFLAVALTAAPSLLRSRQAMALPQGRTATQPGPLGGWVVAVETALAMIVLVAALQSGRSLAELRAFDVGYEPEGLHSVGVSLVPGSHADPGVRARFVAALSERLRATEGVSAGIMGPDMMGRSVTHVHMTPHGMELNEENRFRVQWISVTPGTLETVGIELLEGHDVGWAPPEAPLEVVVSRRLADRFWPGESALGKRVHVNENPHANGVVVGVARDAQHVARYAAPYVVGDAYFSLRQRPAWRLALLTRTAAGASLPLADVREVVRSIDDRVALFDARPMTARLAGEETLLRIVLALTTVYAVVAVSLALFGMLSLVATAAQERRRELAVRAALGAARRTLRWLLVRRVLLAVLVGVACGSVVALLATRAISAVLFGVSPSDPAAYLVVGLVLLLLGLFGALVPARLSDHIPPSEALSLT